MQAKRGDVLYKENCATCHGDNLEGSGPMPALAGKDFWVNAINQGFVTRASAALSIMAGAQSTDITIIDKKSQVATAFANSLNTDTKRAAYDGLAANVVVRTMLSTVGLDTDVVAFQPSIDSTITTLVNNKSTQLFASVAAIISQRCVGCHSSHPTIPGFSPAPLGIRFDTAAQIHAESDRIGINVASEFMPFGNMTGMTTAERAVIADWIAKGAP